MEMSNYRIVKHLYKLDVKTINKAVAVFGNYIQILRASSLKAAVSVQMQGDTLKTEGDFELRNRDFIRVPEPFGRVDLSWEAQAGEWVEIVFITQDPAPEEFEYVSQERGIIDSIANTVTVKVEPTETFVVKTINVSAAMVEYLPANPARRSVAITNLNATNNLHIAPDNVGEVYTLTPNSTAVIDTRGAIWMKSASGGVWQASYVEV